MTSEALTAKIRLRLKISPRPELVLELRDVTCHTGSRSVTCHPTQVNAPALTAASTRFTYPGGMEGCVDLDYPATHRPGVELAISRSRVRRRNHYTTEPPPDLGWGCGVRTRKSC